MAFILDIIEYGVLLVDRIKKGFGNSFRYQKVSGAWRHCGIVRGYTSNDDSGADNQQLLFGQEDGGLVFHNDVLYS
jgi:hypothetical protein